MHCRAKKGNDYVLVNVCMARMKEFSGVEYWCFKPKRLSGQRDAFHLTIKLRELCRYFLPYVHLVLSLYCQV